MATTVHKIIEVDAVTNERLAELDAKLDALRMRARLHDARARRLNAQADMVNEHIWYDIHKKYPETVSTVGSRYDRINGLIITEVIDGEKKDA